VSTRHAGARKSNSCHRIVSLLEDRRRDRGRRQLAQIIRIIRYGRIPRHRHHREDPRDDVGVGVYVGVVECGRYGAPVRR